MILNDFGKTTLGNCSLNSLNGLNFASRAVAVGECLLLPITTSSLMPCSGSVLSRLEKGGAIKVEIRAKLQRCKRSIETKRSQRQYKVPKEAHRPA